MNKNIDILRSNSPLVLTLTFSEDMGYEFNALLQNGVILASPGMLLNYSDLSEEQEDLLTVFFDSPDEFLTKIVEEGLLDITPYESLDANEIDFLLDLLHRSGD